MVWKGGEENKQWPVSMQCQAFKHQEISCQVSRTWEEEGQCVEKKR